MSIPPELLTLAWWLLAALLAVSVAVSLTLEAVKYLGRRYVWVVVRDAGKVTQVSARLLVWGVSAAEERVFLRVLAVALGIASTVFATWYPLSELPWHLQLAAGAAAGAHAEVVYRWALRRLSKWAGA